MDRRASAPPDAGDVELDRHPTPISATNQPHLYFYASGRLGQRVRLVEPAMHALQSLFALGCLLLMYFLARRLARPGRCFSPPCWG